MVVGGSAARAFLGAGSSAFNGLSLFGPQGSMFIAHPCYFNEDMSLNLFIIIEVSACSQSMFFPKPQSVNVRRCKRDASFTDIIDFDISKANITSNVFLIVVRGLSRILNRKAIGGNELNQHHEARSDKLSNVLIHLAPPHQVFWSPPSLDPPAHSRCFLESR